jgi:hypothetical protein
MEIAVLLPLLTQLLGLAASAVVEGPKIIASVKNIWNVVTATTPPTADQDAEYVAALDAAHQALQNS